MELLTRNIFEGWMQKLMERLDRQDELLNERAKGARRAAGHRQDDRPGQGAGAGAHPAVHLGLPPRG